MTQLSIICLSWNHEKYIKQCLESLINQTYNNIEIIYLDNCSTDNSFEKGKAILESSNVKHQIKKFDKNIGMPKAVNYALKNMIKSPYISMIAADDWLEKENYELKINYSLKNPEYGMIASEGYYYYEDKNEYQLISKERLKEGWIFNELLKSNFLFMMGVLIKKEVYDTIGYYDEENSIEDWDFALRFAQKFPLGIINKPLFYYRQHNSNYSKGSDKYYRDCLAVISRYKEHKNAKIGINWINNAYINYMFNSPFKLRNLIYILKHEQINKSTAKKIMKYSFKMFKNGITKTAEK